MRDKGVFSLIRRKRHRFGIPTRNESTNDKEKPPGECSGGFVQLIPTRWFRVACW